MPANQSGRAIDRCREYFDVYLPMILGQLLIPDLRALNACCEIHVSDGESPPWKLTIADGCLLDVGHDGGEAACRFALHAETLLEIVGGRLAPQEAFFAMQIELDGDMETGLMLATVLEPFFQRIAWEG